MSLRMSIKGKDPVPGKVRRLPIQVKTDGWGVSPHPNSNPHLDGSKLPRGILHPFHKESRHTSTFARQLAGLLQIFRHVDKSRDPQHDA